MTGVENALYEGIIALIGGMAALVMVIGFQGGRKW